MRVLLTGAYGRCGTAIIDHLYDKPGYEFTLLDREEPVSGEPYSEYETVVADVADREAVMAATAEHDAVVHLAGDPSPESEWEDVFEPNILGQLNMLDAARATDVQSFVFASTNHVVGMYEIEHRPTVYENGYDLVVDHTAPLRPDSYYGLSKAFGETLGRLYVDRFASPGQFYALRIGNVNAPALDDPAAFARRELHEGADAASAAFTHGVLRKMAMWQSRRDFAQLVDRCLQDEGVTFDIFYGLSDNRNRWFDIEHARAVLGYRPRDRAEDRPIPWDGLPG